MFQIYGLFPHFSTQIRFYSVMQETPDFWGTIGTIFGNGLLPTLTSECQVPSKAAVGTNDKSLKIPNYLSAVCLSVPNTMKLKINTFKTLNLVHSPLGQ